MIINEWQLNSKLNSALQSEQRADFALYLALLSPAVEESAEFFTPDDVSSSELSTNLYQKLGIQPMRRFDLQERDIGLLNQHSQALSSGGLAELKLAIYLNTPPLTQYDDKKRLASDVWQSLSSHSRRHLSSPEQSKPQADPTALYEVLQQLNAGQAA